MNQVVLRVAIDEGTGYSYVPRYSHEGDAGMDLRAADDYIIPAGKSRMVRTGMHMEIPPGYVGLQFPRSGLGSRGITMRNAVGVIDSGYRGEVMCPLWNTTGTDFAVHKGDRVCQLVVMPYASCDVTVSDGLSESDRGDGGIGSTGVR